MSEDELTAEEMAVAVALARTFRRRIYDDTARQAASALRVAGWVHRPAQRAEPPVCPCCLGDQETVCDACGRHSCWAGELMCEDAASAGTTSAAEYAARATSKVQA